MRYVTRSTDDINRCIRAFNHYYALLRGHIDQGAIKSSLDRGAFTHPNQILTAELQALLGPDRHRLSLGYGPEAGEQQLREAIASLENSRHGTAYTQDNVAIVAGAWCGVELVIEELAELYGGHSKELAIAVIGPTHYQLFQRPIEILGAKVTGFDFVNFEGSTPRTEDEISSVLSSEPDLVFVTNPNNPVGEFFPSVLLQSLVRQCESRGIIVLIDEMQNFLATSTKNLGYGKWIEAGNVIRVDSFSKRFGLAEYRSGWVIAPTRIIGDRFRGVIGRTRGLMGNAPRAANDTTLRLLEMERTALRGATESPDSLTRFRESLGRKAAFVERRMHANPRVTVLERDACFNLTIRVSGVGRDIELADRLMRAGTMLMPCEGYGYRSEDAVMRITFAERWERIRHSLNTFDQVLSTG